MEKLIKHVEKQVRKVQEPDPENEGEFIEKEIFLNNVIDFFDHNGRLRHFTEDELRAFSENLKNVLIELEKLKEDGKI